MDHNPWEHSADAEYVQGVVPSSPRKSNSAFDIHYRRVLSVWPWMIPAGLLFLFAAWFYLRYQDDVYKISASIVIQDPSLQAMNVYSSKDPINDNIARLRSPTLMKRVVDTMGLQYQAKVEGNIKDRFLYEEIKWRVINRSPNIVGSLIFEVEPGKEGFTWKKGQKTGVAQWNIPFQIDSDLVIINRKITDFKNKFICIESDSWSVAFSLTSSLSVTGSKISNVVELSLEDIQRQRAVDIINNLIQLYNFSVLTEKRKSQEQAYRFISERLEPLAFQVDSIEEVLAKFKAEKGIILQGDFLNKIWTYEGIADQFRLKESIVNSSASIFNNPEVKNNQLSVVGFDDSNLQQTVSSLLKLYEERQKLALTVTENNPKLQLLDKQIADLRENLTLQLNHYRRINTISEQFNKDKKTEAEQKFSLTPFEEKRLNEIVRYQTIKLNQFLDLLKKKEEAGIAVASVSIETFLIRPALVPKTPISPARINIMLIAFLIGIWIPFAVALIAELLNNKIVTKNQLQQMLTPPVLAELDFVEKNADVLHVKRRDRSIFGEQIRSLRAALRYYSKENEPFYIMVTSSMSGEGKSFISANLAASFSLQGKRVALLEFDLRRPKLSKRFGYEQKSGISTILIGKDVPGQCAFRIQDEGHLDLFPAGPVPPNPSELLSSEKMKEFKSYLDANYDVIVIDTPPIGIVADAQLIQPWVDITLVITRFRLTVREQIREIEEWYNAGMFKPMAILLNGVTVKGYYGNKYSYYYTKRMYGYKYYSPEPELDEKV